jgi:metal-responsive CopG/Arc/MetJ family transcriptional regulator
MSRRRSADPTTAISITLPRTLLDEIDSKLTRSDSRSAWIARACMNELVDDEINVPTRQLMAALYARIDDETLKTVLLDRLTSGSSS